MPIAVARGCNRQTRVVVGTRPVRISRASSRRQPATAGPAVPAGGGQVALRLVADAGQDLVAALTGLARELGGGTALGHAPVGRLPQQVGQARVEDLDGEIVELDGGQFGAVV